LTSLLKDFGFSSGTATTGFGGDSTGSQGGKESAHSLLAVSKPLPAADGLPESVCEGTVRSVFFCAALRFHASTTSLGFLSGLST
jgi:hypothetical protein